jgi:hypothetical protein
MAKPFCENRRVARCFAELFWNMIYETIHDAITSIRFIFWGFTLIISRAVHIYM